jgi:hypothetical protein
LGEKKIHPTLVYSLNLIYEKANLHEDWFQLNGVSCLPTIWPFLYAINSYWCLPKVGVACYSPWVKARHIHKLNGNLNI